MNRKKCLLLVSVLFLAGCTMGKLRYGDFVAHSPVNIVYKSEDGKVLAIRTYTVYSGDWHGSAYTEKPEKQPTETTYYIFEKWIYSNDALNDNGWVPSDTIKHSYLYDYNWNNHDHYSVMEIEAYPIYKEVKFEDVFYFEWISSRDSYVVELLNSAQYENLYVPEKHNNKSVIALGPKSFYNQPSLKRIELPNSIASIGDYSFAEDKALDNLSLNKGLKRIGLGAFSNCTSLSEINFPESLEEMGPKSFYNSGLIEADLLKTRIQRVPSNAFQSSSKLKTVKLPNVTMLSQSSFSNCQSLESVDASQSSDLVIDDNAFKNDPSLKTITIGKGGNVTIGESAFEGNTSLNQVSSLGKQVIIRKKAFANCSSLKELLIPEKATIQQAAFTGCSKDLKLFYEGSSVPDTFDTNYNQGFEGNLYFFSEREPSGFGYYWHYVNGSPKAW